MKLILLGAPGAGKGTQAALLSKTYGIPEISTGNIIREAIKAGTPLGKEAKSYAESGKLVPDALVIDLVKDRLSQSDCAQGFILDGFPRTVAQAQALDDMGAAIDAVIHIDLADDTVVRRMSGRRVCVACGAPFHVEQNPPKQEDVCDRCGAPLITREDDKPETVRDRLLVYHEQTQPLIDFYGGRGQLFTVAGDRPVDAVQQQITAHLGGAQ